MSATSPGRSWSTCSPETSAHLEERGHGCSQGKEAALADEIICLETNIPEGEMKQEPSGRRENAPGHPLTYPVLTLQAAFQGGGGVSEGHLCSARGPAGAT